MPVIKTKTTYLQMFSPTAIEIAAPGPDLKMSRIELPSIDYYRHLYRKVGAAFYWVDRLAISDEKLRAVLHDDQGQVRCVVTRRQLVQPLIK